MVSHLHTPFLRGKKVSLRAVDDSEISLIADLINDPEVYLNLLIIQSNRAQDSREFVDMMWKSNEHQLFAICGHDDRWLGMIGLHNINWCISRLVKRQKRKVWLSRRVRARRA